MRRPKPVQKPVKALPQIGDFIVRDAWDGKCGAHVAKKTGPRWDDYETMILCRKCSGVVLCVGKPKFCPYCRGTDMEAISA